MAPTSDLPIILRPAYPDDAAALRRLAGLDSARVPAGRLLVVEVEGQIRVAVSVSDLKAIADPFFPTAHMVELARAHITATDGRPVRTWREFLPVRRRPSGPARAEASLASL